MIGRKKMHAKELSSGRCATVQQASRVLAPATPECHSR
jgi:hypothetical protein